MPPDDVKLSSFLIALPIPWIDAEVGQQQLKQLAVLLTQASWLFKKGFAADCEELCLIGRAVMV